MDASRRSFRVGVYTRAIHDKRQKEAEFSESGGELTASSKKVGQGCDNPVDPMALRIVQCGKEKVDQKKRSLMLVFRDTSIFEVTFRTVCSGCMPDGRNFLFAFKSALIDSC